MSATNGLLVLYIPSLDRRRMSPEITPYLSEQFARRPVIELETHPSIELLPTIVTGQWPHEHCCWQVKIKRNSQRTRVQRFIDALPRWLTTTAQCILHRCRSSFDLPTVEPRRRRQFENYRVKQKRLTENAVANFDFGGAPTIFSALNGAGRYRILRTLRAGDQPIERIIDGAFRFDLLDHYAIDILSHWNLDRPDVVREGFRRVDAFVARAHQRARQLGMRTVVLVDHGQELVRSYIDVRRLLSESGVPSEEYSYYIEVTNARFWFFTPRARAVLMERLAGVKGAVVLSNEEMARYHVAFRDEDGWGDVYLIADPGVAFFPHDFYHPLVNAYMSRKTPEQAARLWNPRHRGTHGHLPGCAADTGLLVPFDDELEAVSSSGQLVDMAPTFLSLMGVTIPAAMSGRPLLRARA